MLLKSKKREIKGKKVKTLRKEGFLPAILYGGGENISLSVNSKDFGKVWEEAGSSTVLELEVEGVKKNVLIQDVSVDPLKSMPLHVDFFAIRMDKPIVARVSITFEGESPAVKNLGGVLVKVIHELEVEALPKDLPSEIIVDITGLCELNDQFTVESLNLGDGVKTELRPEEVIVLVKAQQEEEAVEEERTIEDVQVETKGKEEKEESEGEDSEKVPGGETKKGE